MRSGESPEGLLKRFRKKVARDRILSDAKKKAVLCLQERAATHGHAQGQTSRTQTPVETAKQVQIKKRLATRSISPSSQAIAEKQQR
jgi:hypothetical protein